MRKMKDSGIEWIGEIPEGWELRKGKSLYRVATGKLDANAENPDGDYPFFTCSMAPKRINSYSFDCEALLVAGNGLVGFTQYYKGKFDAYQRTYVLSDFRNVLPSFLRYYVSVGLPMEVQPKSIGSVIQFIKLGDLLNFNITLPSIEQQTIISNYLEFKIIQIDAILSKTRSSIEEYKKLKQAVITQAVTKGVRGEREMKDSGVEWIGEIPKKWNRCKLNSICTFINGDRSKNYPSSEDFQDIGIPFIGADSLNGFFVDTYSARHISPAKYASMGGLKITQGDILYTLRGSTIGKNAIANFNDGTIASSLVGIRVKSPFLASSSFLFYWLNSLNEFVQRDLCINGSTAPNLSAENVAQFFIYIPDITEQHEIADYLDAKCAEIDKLIAKKEQLVKELDSYKKSLIYEVVTGKREV